MSKVVSLFVWSVVALAGAGAIAWLALLRGEAINAAWLLTAAGWSYLVAYRFYSKLIAAKVFVLEASAIGLVLLFVALYAGRAVAENPSLAPTFTLSGVTLAIAVMVYGFAASVLPVWLLLAPRDYLSAFVKIGVVVALAIGIVVVLPPLQMPAVTRFTDGTGPVFAGKLFPFAFITIACGAISGFHALISS